MRPAMFAVSVAVFMFVRTDGHAQSNDLQTELAHCLSFSGAVERLSCYDRLARQAGRLAPQISSPQPPSTPSRADLGPPPQNFGRQELPGASFSTEEARMTATITDFQKDRTDHFTVALNNGQVWQQVASDTAVAQYRPGTAQTVTISRGSLGSYDLTFSGRNMIFKVRRVR